jgi:hypothetical protein
MLPPIRLVLLLLGLSACAAPGPTTDETLPAPPLARAAVIEWRSWGRIVIVGWPDERPADNAATPQRLARLNEYWTALPGGWRIAQRHTDLRSGLAAMEQRIGGAPDGEDGADTNGAAVAGLDDIGFYAYPAWSAAFISAVARLAHLPESDLPSSSRHARYIDAMLARALADPDGAPFQPRAPGEYAPAPGDLICADRSYVPLMHWTDRLAERGRPRPMHCDVVVSTAPGSLDAIGGNVRGHVARRRFPRDAAGRLLPAPFDRPGFVLILADRANLPPPARTGP